MANTKTAISLQETLFEQVEVVVREMKISRKLCQSKPKIESFIGADK
jgi:hypothetical protein